MNRRNEEKKQKTTNNSGTEVGGILAGASLEDNVFTPVFASEDVRSMFVCADVLNIAQSVLHGVHLVENRLIEPTWLSALDEGFVDPLDLSNVGDIVVHCRLEVDSSKE